MVKWNNNLGEKPSSDWESNHDTRDTSQDKSRDRIEKNTGKTEGNTGKFKNKTTQILSKILKEKGIDASQIWGIFRVNWKRAKYLGMWKSGKWEFIFEKNGKYKRSNPKHIWIKPTDIITKVWERKKW